MPSRATLLGGTIGGAALLVVIFGLFAATGAALSQMNTTGQSGQCGDLVPSKIASHTTSAPAATSENNSGDCFPGNPYGAQVVQWAKKMADALYINPACGAVRGAPNCNDTWYTSAFPQPVIAYGQAWCHSHNDCADWANGSYQCVSFVRGAYSQVYPMKFSNNAFGLWATYQHVPGWQEIPATAAPSPLQRGLPEPGDVMVFRDLGVGHVAIVLTVQPPNNGRNGWIEFANANSSSAYDRMPLLPSLIVDTSGWSGNYIVWGYLRPRINASQRLVRLSQVDPQQYSSMNEYNTWAYSACSAAAMTEVLDAYGLHLRIHDVLQVESSLGYITPLDGLTQEVGIAETVRRFGFQTTWGDHWTLDRVIGNANAGSPVIVSWPPSRYARGHIVVVIGGDRANVILADSSTWNRHTLSRKQFMQWWAGFAAVVVPS